MFQHPGTLGTLGTLQLFAPQGWTDLSWHGLEAQLAVVDWGSITVGTRPGKHTKNYGKPPSFMAKCTINHHFSWLNAHLVR